MVAVYLLSFPYQPGLRSPNELCRLLQTRALVEFGDLDLNRAIQTYGPVGDLSIYRGRYYPSKAPLMSFAAVPIYAGLRMLLGGTPTAVSELALVYFSRLFLTVLPTLLLVVWLRRFLTGFVSKECADAIVLTYLLGTLAFSYSLLFMSHQPSAVLLFVSFYIVWRWARGDCSERMLVLAGTISSAAVVAEYTTALGVLALALFGLLSLRERRQAFSASLRATTLFVLGSLPLTVLLLWYHALAFGGPLESGYRHLADTTYQPWHEGGFLGIGLPHFQTLIFSFFSPLRGLFTLSPMLLLAVPGVWLLFQKSRIDHGLRPLAWATLSVAAAYTYFTCSFSYESWGWTTGPRHLTSLVPFLLLPCAMALERARNSHFRAMCGVLLASSVLITAALTFVNYIPDDVSNALFALSLPLTRVGKFTPSILCAIGITNPIAGIAIWICVIMAVIWLFWINRPTASIRAWLALMVAATVIFSFQLLSFRNSPADRAALALLQRIWLAPPGRPINLFER